MTALTSLAQTTARHLTPVRRLLLILILLSLPLLQMIWQGEHILTHGTKVVLKTAPVDPRSLFQGDYIILNYEISRIARDTLADKQSTIPANTPVYVLLRKPAEGEAWEMATANLNAPSYIPEGHILLTGRTRQNTPPGNGSVFVDYGIENFFVTENTGHEIESIGWRTPSRIMVEAYISRDGEARIGQLLIDGKSLLAPGGLGK